MTDSFFFPILSYSGHAIRSVVVQSTDGHNIEIAVSVAYRVDRHCYSVISVKKLQV